MEQWPLTYAAFATGRHFADGAPATPPSSPGEVGAFGTQVVAAALVEIRRQLLVLDLARA